MTKQETTIQWLKIAFAVYFAWLGWQILEKLNLLAKVIE